MTTIYTEDQAKERRCPFKAGMCEASACLSWRPAAKRHWPSIKVEINREYERLLNDLDQKRAAAPWWKRPFMEDRSSIETWRLYELERKAERLAAESPATKDATPYGFCRTIEGDE